VTNGTIQSGTALLNNHPIRVIEQQVTYMANGAVYATALFTNVLWNGTGSAVTLPPAPDAAFTGWFFSDGVTEFTGGNIATNCDLIVYTVFSAGADFDLGGVIYTNVREQAVGTFKTDDGGFDYETAVVKITLDMGDGSPVTYDGKLVLNDDGSYTVILVGPVDEKFIGGEVTMTVKVNDAESSGPVNVVKGPSVVLDDDIFTDSETVGTIHFDPENEGDLGITNNAPVDIVVDMGGGVTNNVTGYLVDNEDVTFTIVVDDEDGLPEGGTIVGIVVNPDAVPPTELPAGSEVGSGGECGECKCEEGCECGCDEGGECACGGGGEEGEGGGDGTITKRTDYRVRVTAIDVDPVSMDVSLEWDITPFVSGSIVTNKTQIRFADVLGSPSYTVSQWYDLRDEARVTRMHDIDSAHGGIAVTAKAASPLTAHAATVPGKYLRDFRQEYRGSSDETAGFFYVIVNGALKE
jgi:hypothetical protein